MNVSNSLVAVVGAGNGGHAMAADLVSRGHKIILYELPSFAAGLEGASRKGSIELLEGDGSTVSPVETSTDIKDVLARSEIVNVVVPSNGHDAFFTAMLPYLRPHHIVVIWAGRLGALRLAKLAKETGASAFSIIEATTLPYGTQLEGPGIVRVLFRARELHVAHFPGDSSQRGRAELLDLYPEVRFRSHIVETFLRNSSLLVLPTATLVNAGCIERSGGDYYLFRDGVTESVAELVGAVNKEFAAVGRAFGAEIPVYSQATIRAMGSVESATFTAAKPGYYAELRGPEQLRHRYLLENIPFGFVPVSELGAAAGVKTPVIDGLIAVSCALLGSSLIDEARTLSTLGLDGLSLDEITARIVHGR